MNEWWNSQISAWLRHTHWHSGWLKYEKSALWNFKKIIKYGKNIEKIEEKSVPNPFLGYLEPKFWIPGTITILLQCEEKKVDFSLWHFKIHILFTAGCTILSIFNPLFIHWISSSASIAHIWLYNNFHFFNFCEPNNVQPNAQLQCRRRNNKLILYAQLKIKMLYNSFWSEGCGLSHVVN